jgi:hypothetical protein
VVQARTLINPVNEASNPEDVAETRPGRLVEATISFRFHVEVHVACRRGRAVTRFTHSQCLSGVPGRVGDCDCCDLCGSSCRTPTFRRYSTSLSGPASTNPMANRPCISLFVLATNTLRCDGSTQLLLDIFFAEKDLVLLIVQNLLLPFSTSSNYSNLFVSKYRSTCVRL